MSKEGKVKAVVLVDPAGIHANPELAINFVLDPVRAFGDHYARALANIQSREDPGSTRPLNKMDLLRNKFQAVRIGLKETVAEILAGMCTPEGEPKSLIDMAKKQLGGAQIKHVKSIAADYDLETRNAGMALSDMLVDSTEEARAEITAPVVFVPMIGARVVNVLWEEVGPRVRAYDGTYSLGDFRELLTGQKDPQSMDFIDEGIAELVRERLQQLFPNAPIYFVPIDSSSHGRAFSKSPALQQKLADVVNNILNPLNAQNSQAVTTVL